MFDPLSRLASKHPRRMAIVALLVFVIAGVFGGPAAGMLNAPNPFSAPGSQSAQAEALVEHATGTEISPGVLAVVSAPPGSPAVTSVVRAITGVPGVAKVTAPRAGQRSPLVSASGRLSIVTATLFNGADSSNVVKAIESALKGRTDVVLGGGDVAGEQTGQQATADLGLAELLAFPLLFILALLIFRGVAAVLPLAVGGLSVLVTSVVLRLINGFFPLSVFALNLVIGLGLGLAVDYSLFLVSRFREGLAAGQSAEDALRAMLHSTGRTVVFSACTVAAALACLTVFPERFLISMGLGGAIVALVAAASALLLLPPLLVMLRGRVGKIKPPTSQGLWYKLANNVMRHPVIFAVSAAVALLVLASPATRVTFSGVDALILPTSQSARVAQDMIDADFPGLHGGQPIVIATKAPPTAGPALTTYARRLRGVPGVASVSPPRQLGAGVWEIVATGPSSAIGPASQLAVAGIRETSAPFQVLVGGAAAEFVDQKSAIAGSLPLALILLTIVTLLILWFMTGSVILPFKSLLMNGLTAAAATGILVFIFQDGRFTDLLDYTSQGGIEETDFLVLAAIAFALSTDYGVFLLARIREARAPDRTEREAVAIGMQRTGRLVTNASLLLAVAIGAFATSKLVILKEVGVGTAVAVLLDAFVVRALLVPSLMALLGKWNWWSPAPLRRLHERIGRLEAQPQPQLQIQALAGAAMAGQPEQER